MEEELNFEDLQEGLDKSKFPEVLLPATRNIRKEIMYLSMLSRRGGGRAWGGDLIVFLGPGVGHLTNLVLPGGGVI